MSPGSFAAAKTWRRKTPSVYLGFKSGCSWFGIGNCDGDASGRKCRRVTLNGDVGKRVTAPGVPLAKALPKVDNALTQPHTF